MGAWKEGRQAVAVVARDTQSQAAADDRNPFAKKKTGEVNTSTTSRTGVVFDSVTTKSTLPEKVAFGDRVSGAVKPKPPRRPQHPVLIKKDAAGKEKENTAENGQGEMLKGFSLWLAENKSSLGEDAESEGLTQWKSLAKEEKERYRTPRLPDCSGKRKREEEPSPTEKKQQKTGFSSKLASFAFSEK